MIGIIDYGLGNLASVGNALRNLEVPFKVSSDVDVLKTAKALIFPGVGAAGQGMENLRVKKLDKFLNEQAKRGVPILGICLGMQLMFDSSEEGNVKCLGLIGGKVKRFRNDLKVPQIGWNRVVMANGEWRMVNGKLQITDDRNEKNNFSKSFSRKMDAIFKNIIDESYFYFVNSYYCVPEDSSFAAGVTDYGGEFCSVVVKDNLVGVQFHPEKSGENGLRLLRNFVKSSVAG